MTECRSAAPTAEELDAVLRALGREPWEVARLGEPVAAMVEHRVLIERPVLVTGDGRAALGRPPEDVLGLLG